MDDFVFNAPAQYSYNLSNFTACVPNEQFVLFASKVVFFDDALKIGIACYLLGMGTIILFDFIDKRWKVK